MISLHSKARPTKKNQISEILQLYLIDRFFVIKNFVKKHIKLFEKKRKKTRNDKNYYHVIFLKLKDKGQN